jgi:hypothetical protein
LRFFGHTGISIIFITTVVACGGGGGGGSGASGSGAVNTPAAGQAVGSVVAGPTDSLAAKQSFSDDDIRHFLRRTHFSIEPGKVEEIQAQGLSLYIDQMLNFPALGTQPYETEAALLLADEDDPAGLEGMFPGNSDVVNWNISLLMNNPNAFQEVLGMFWQDHFGVNMVELDNDEHHLMVSYINMLRDRGTGSFRNLMVDVSRHGAMQVFLDGANNNKFAPNENYAREFWELFTLGVDNGYTENDIIEASRAFTGWRREYNPNTGLTQVIFDPENKAVGSKTPLGVPVTHDLSADDYATMVDLTMTLTDESGSSRVARFLSSKLLAYFAQQNPDPQLVDNVAAELLANNMQVGPVLKTLFLSEAFYSASSREGLVRDFYEQVVGLVRTTGMTESEWVYRSYLSNMNSVPSMPPSVEGWPEGDDKINAQSSGIELPNFVNELITNRNSQNEDGYDIAAALQPQAATGPAEVVDHVAQLLGVELDDVDRRELIAYMNVHINRDGEETPLTYTPQNEEHQNRKLRNLIWILCQHPSFQVK